ncbi:MAG: glycine cleavage system aminomethyltransferase GcvT [Desulfobacterales bacterium]|nr:glycine cleavage system aminomethyltransferase GcvT [Desulfobacterales bacterium]
MTHQTQKTVFFDRHVSLGAEMVDFSGWQMPLQYGPGIVQEHLITRKSAGLFDVSHMGRFRIGASGALGFLQRMLTNNAAALQTGQSQYTLVPNKNGGAIDDAYLYRLAQNEYLLVVNAANRETVWRHLQQALKRSEKVDMRDQTEELTMLGLQGPLSKTILQGVLDSGSLPEPLRNYISPACIKGADVFIARTGYTGEPVCFELFVERRHALMLWNLLLERGAVPIGLGARDTLRLEAGLPLYGHELGLDPDGGEIPIFASNLSRFAVSFSPLKGNYIGRKFLESQFIALKEIMNRNYSRSESLPRRIQPIALLDKGVARAGSRVFQQSTHVGVVTSGTMVPYWKFEGDGIESCLTDEKGLRAIGLALIDSRINEGDSIQIEIRGKKMGARVVPYHLKSNAPPFARAILWPAQEVSGAASLPENHAPAAVQALIKKTAANTRWRRQECINLIPSEQTPSPLVRTLSIMDPSGRYAEHKRIVALKDAEVFYYQGTDFIAEAENLLQAELCRFLGCSRVETRLISGQMANTAVFSALVDYLNRIDRKIEPRRIQRVINHHIIKGGHLSAQPMGALRDFVARDPLSEKPAVVNFPVMAENPFQIDTAACQNIIADCRPELIILGKSMMLHPEPVSAIRAVVDDLSLDCIIMYDMAHVLGLCGPYFQEPFKEGAHIVTGSTHKTFFGTQRGIIAADMAESDPHYKFWETIERRAFPGSVSNHHLGTLLGLLMATYEMNYFKADYQQKVLQNAQALAKALKYCGLNVAGDPSVSYTQTHQVIVQVGDARGPEVARRLEENNIIVNYQATSEDDGFTAASALRMGVAEMTRFGMMPADFRELAQLMHAVIELNKNVKKEVTTLRKRFLEMKYCFRGPELEGLMGQLHQLI